MPRVAFDDSDDEDKAPVAQSLTEFSTTTLDTSTVKEPLVIARIPNSFRRSNNYVPNALLQPTQKAGKTVAELEAAERARNNVYGLSKGTARTVDDLLPGHVSESATNLTLGSVSHVLTDEEKAVQELLHPEEETTDHTIAKVGGNELFSNVNVHPDMSTMDDYEAVPVESFGLAMLRGMGYDPKSEAQKDKVKEKLRRPDFLGLGASKRPEDTKTSQELAKKRFEKRKEDKNYVPVIKVNKRTGEVVKDESPRDLRMTNITENGRSSPHGGANGRSRDRHDSAASRNVHGSRSHHESVSSAGKTHDRHRRAHDRSRERRRQSRSPRRDSRDHSRYDRDRDSKKR